MTRYCRAYEKRALLAAGRDGEPELPDVGYLWDDYSVTAEPFADGASLIDVDDRWRRFCDEVLGFHVPVADVTG